MREIDLPEFDRAVTRLCAGFNQPPTQVRKDAYWQGFRAFPIRDFVTAVDNALAQGDSEDMPSVPGLRKLVFAPRAGSTPPPGVRMPTVQEQLCDYVMLKHYPRGHEGKFTLDQMRQSGQPWTYLYREWRDESRPKGFERCAECTGVLVPAFGALGGFRVSAADMLADPLHAKVMQRFLKPEFSSAARDIQQASLALAGSQI